VAQPGDIFLVHAGGYGGRITFTRPGTSTGHVVWKSAGDGEAVFAGIDVSASYVWLEGLTLRDQPFALMSKNAPTGVVISRCSFFNNHYSIYLQRGGSNWYIADNTIVGDTPYSTQSLDGEGSS
jgi:nitrous oxidase accessory protein NosD